MKYVEELYSIDNQAAVVIGGGSVPAGCMTEVMAKTGAVIRVDGGFTAMAI